MELLLLSLCLVHLSGSTFADGNGPVIIKVKEGDDATLPCYIKDKDILSEQFEWTKDGKEDVCLYKDGQFSGQGDQFRGRVSHFDHELKNGDASIKIRDTKVSDSGDYTCNLPNLQPKQTFTVRLRVGPVIIKVKEGDDVTLPCYIKNKNIVSERFEWTKDGKKEVYVHEGHKFSGQDDQFRDRVSHFDHELKHGDASITISNTKVSDSGVYTCDFPNLHQTFTIYLVVGELKDRSSEFPGKAAKVYILKPEPNEDVGLLKCLVSDVSPGFKLNISWFDSSGNKLIEEIGDTESGKTYILQTTVKKSGNYRCVATMEELSHRVHSETYVQISVSNIPVVVWVGLAVTALIIVAGAVFIYKRCKKNRSRI